MSKPKENIPVYNIANLAARLLDPDDFMIESLASYVERQPLHLHNSHRHNFYHLVCFTGGKGSHSIDFIQWPVEVGQLYFMTPGQVHSWNFDGIPDGYIIHFTEGFLRSFLLDPNYLDRFSFFSGHAADCVVRLASPMREKVVALLADMLDEYHGHTGGGTDAERTMGLRPGMNPDVLPPGGNPDLLRAQLVQLFLLVQSGAGCRNPDTAAAVTQKQQLLVALRKLMDQHYKTLRRPSEYAGLLFITPNHLNALCRDLLGRSAGEVIRDRVLLEAKRLLTNAGMTAAEIAYELNFQDNSYFNRFFKKYEGVTPDEFRKKHLIRRAKPQPD